MDFHNMNLRDQDGILRQQNKTLRSHNILLKQTFITRREQDITLRILCYFERTRKHNYVIISRIFLMASG